MNKFMKVLVNVITLSRIFFSILLVCVSGQFSKLKFLIYMAFLFFTDQIDGFLARKARVQTLFGATMDTAADKIMCITLLIPLVRESSFSLMVLCGEVLILLINFIAYLNGKQVKVIFLGKVKMWILAITIIVGYAWQMGYLNVLFFSFFSIFTFLIQVVVMVKYIVKLCKNEDIRYINRNNSTWPLLFDTEYYLKIRKS